ncbi:MAG: hypothetical protein OXB90_04965 [Acidimicrobiaceae bacterium]|nr:hypothetical protein [Acidimicrobiaceae bacterium]
MFVVWVVESETLARVDAVCVVLAAVGGCRLRLVCYRFVSQYVVPDTNGRASGSGGICNASGRVAGAPVGWFASAGFCGVQRFTGFVVNVEHLNNAQPAINVQTRIGSTLSMR